MSSLTVDGDTRVGAAFGVLASIITGVGAAFGVLAGAIGFLVSPIGLVIAAMALLGTYFVQTTDIAGQALDWLGGRFNALKDTALQTYQGSATLGRAGRMNPSNGSLIHLLPEPLVISDEENWPA